MVPVIPTSSPSSPRICSAEYLLSTSCIQYCTVCGLRGLHMLSPLSPHRPHGYAVLNICYPDTDSPHSVLYSLWSPHVVPIVPTPSPSSPWICSADSCYPNRDSLYSVLYSLWSPWSPHVVHIVPIIPTSSRRSPHHPQPPRYQPIPPPTPLGGGSSKSVKMQ